MTPKPTVCSLVSCLLSLSKVDFPAGSSSCIEHVFALCKHLFMEATDILVGSVEFIEGTAVSPVGNFSCHYTGNTVSAFLANHGCREGP